MDRNNILNIHHISLNEELVSQQEVFERIAELAVQNGIASSQKKVVEGLLERERLSTTGFLDGFAIPHTQVGEIVRPGIVILSTKHGIEWRSMDDQPTRFFIALLIPKNEAGTIHLQILSSLSRMLMHDDTRQNLLSAESAQEVLEKIMPILE